MTRSFAIAAVLFVCIAPPRIAGETTVTAWTPFTREDGLAHNWVKAIAQTTDGAIWFGTSGGGISRYDGRTWRTYDASNDLPGSRIGALHVSGAGEVWATTETGPSGRGSQHILRFSGEGWTSVPMPEELAQAGVLQIVGVGEKAVCFATHDGGILHFDGMSWKAITTEDGLFSNSVTCLLRTEGGGMVAAHGGGRGRGGTPPRGGPGPGRTGLSGLSPGAGRWAPLEEGADLPGMTVQAMAQAPDGAIWLGTRNGGVARIDSEDWRIYTTEGGLPSDRIRVVACADDGSVWVGTDAGVAQLGAVNSGRWRAFTEADGLPNSFITSLHLSSDNSIWVGTVGGAARLNRTGWVHHEQWPGRRDRGGIVMALGRSGTVWAATGEALYSLSGGRWIPMARHKAYTRSVVGLLVGDADDVWWATRDALTLYSSGRHRSIGLPTSGTGQPSLIRAVAPASGGGYGPAARGGPSDSMGTPGPRWTSGYPGRSPPSAKSHRARCGSERLTVLCDSRMVTHPHTRSRRASRKGA